MSSLFKSTEIPKGNVHTIINKLYMNLYFRFTIGKSSVASNSSHIKWLLMMTVIVYIQKGYVNK